MINGRRGFIRIRSNVSRALLLSLVVLSASLVLLPTAFASARPKILCLHAAGSTGESFSKMLGMKDLEEALPGYEFVYANAAYQLWEGYKDEYGAEKRMWIPYIPDPAGGKKQRTTDAAYSDASIEALDELLASEGPFTGILGYSQGAAYVPVYLSRVPDNTFDFALTFCGYPTLTHLGILSAVEERSPVANISSLVWIGKRDVFIKPSLTQETIPFFQSPALVESSLLGHEVPRNNDPSFSKVVSFILREGGDSGDANESNMPTSGDANFLSLRFVCVLFCCLTILMGWQDC